MSNDTTAVTLSVLSSQAEAAKRLFDTSADEEGIFGTEACFTFYDVNYGELRFLPELVKAGIAYDSDWERGDQYKAGTESIRFRPDGTVENKTIYEGDLAAPLCELLPLIDNHDELKKYILIRQEHFAVLPWDNQEEYGKLYRTIQLINPSKQ